MEKVTARSASIFRWRVSGAESFLPGFNRFEVLPPFSWENSGGERVGWIIPCPVKTLNYSCSILAAIGLGAAPLYGATIASTDGNNLTVTCPDSGGSPQTAVSFGAVGEVGDLIDINTINSVGLVDTELAVYSASGDLLAANDDTTIGGRIRVLSRIIFEAPSEGTYYIASGSYNSFFGNGFFAEGPVGETVTTTVNGVDASFEVGGSGAFWTSFDVVPEPSSLGLVAFAGLALLRRHRS